jgi:hypothetical protein
MRTKKLQVIPVSRAKTALGLILAVKKAILADPKRVDMGTVVEDSTNPDHYFGHQKPACGTVGCFAGWIGVLAKGREWSLNGNVFSQVEALLGPGIRFDFMGDDGIYHNVFNAGAGDTCNHFASGTKKHAIAVGKRIDGFIQRNREALKARKLIRVDGQLVPAPGQN